MTKSILIFIASLLLLLPIVLYAGNISASQQLLICSPFLLLLGIPHGAIDNVLFQRNHKTNNTKFIGIYLVFVGLNVALWVMLPTTAYVLFLLLSAYHFGQSQFSHYFNKQPLAHKSLYLFWGIAILSGLILFNIAEINTITGKYNDFKVFGAVHHLRLLQTIFFSSTIATIFLLLFFVYKRQLDLETLFMEVLLLGLVLVCFFLMPLLIGFTLYFVILHSFKVLKEEYKFLQSENIVSSWSSFIKVLTPFTLFSVLGICFLSFLIYLNLLPLSYGYLFLIVISSITLPHVFVMNTFYEGLFSTNFYKRFSSNTKS